MNDNELFNYLVATDQLDDFLGYEEKDIEDESQTTNENEEKEDLEDEDANIKQ